MIRLPVFPMARLIAFAFVGTTVIAATSPWSVAATEKSASRTASFLQKAVEEQQLEIVLARLAIMNAANDEIKAFGARMIQDHQQANQEVRFLAIKEDVHLLMRLNERAIYQKAQLSGLIGTEFDQAYITTMLRDHAEILQEFEQAALTEQENEVRQWAASSLTQLRDHLERAKALASSMGIDPGRDD